MAAVRSSPIFNPTQPAPPYKAPCSPLRGEAVVARKLSALIILILKVFHESKPYVAHVRAVHRTLHSSATAIPAGCAGARLLRIGFTGRPDLSCGDNIGSAFLLFLVEALPTRHPCGFGFVDAGPSRLCLLANGLVLYCSQMAHQEALLS